MAHDSQIRENYFNTDILLFGVNNYSSDTNSETRFLYGFFNGFEYFRPGITDPTLEWSRQIYKKQPHIQYVIWRTLQGGFVVTSKGRSITTFSMMIGFGPSINSSLTAVGLSEEEEAELSHIFKSIKYRKQNYYYSVAAPFSTSLICDHVYNFRFALGYNFYIFYPMENENAYDMLSIIKSSIGYYLIDGLLINVNYEYWYIDSKVRSKRKSHFWNRLIIEFKYIL